LANADIGIMSSGDAFMLRGRSPLTGVSAGGVADVFLRASGLPSLDTVTARAMVNNDGWIIFLDKESSQGVVKVVSVRSEERELSASSLDISYGASLDGAEIGVDNWRQARGGAFQTISIGAVGLGELADKDVEVDVYRFPGIGSAQALFLPGGKFYSPFLKVSARAASPIFLGMSFKSSRSLSEVEEDDVRRTISEAVSALPVGSERMDASLVVEAFATATGDARPVFPVVMSATSMVDGSTWAARSNEGFIGAPADDLFLNKANRVWCCPSGDIRIL